MPNAANITVKKFDGTTDVIYTSVSPSPGDGAPAIWRNQTVGSAAAHYPEFRLSSREGSAGKERRLRSTYLYPQIAANSTTGVTSVVEKATASTDWVVPKGMSTVDIQQFAAQYANLLAAAIIKQCVVDGVSAT